MKNKLLFSIITALLISASLPGITRAQMMRNIVSSTANSQTVQDEAAGKAVLEKLQSKQTSCSNLVDDDFDTLGDYYMGQMMGTSHSAMDALMTQRIGADNERLMHVALGKRLSGCDTSAVFPIQGAGFLPMMSYGGFSSGWAGLLWWVLIIAGFTWITPGSFILGAFYMFVSAWVFGAYYVWMHNSSLISK